MVRIHEPATGNLKLFFLSLKNWIGDYIIYITSPQVKSKTKNNIFCLSLENLISDYIIW